MNYLLDMAEAAMIAAFLFALVLGAGLAIGTI